MVMMASREAKNRFGELLDTAQREPVLISKKGRSVAVVLSQQEYDRLRTLEDAAWTAHADAALQQAEWVGTDTALGALKELTDADA